MKNSSVVIGNSSSGLLEAPTLKIPVVNIGNRQKNRLASSNIINSSTDKKSIINGINKSLSKQFGLKLTKIKSVYGKSGASKKCIKILKKLNLENILLKKFNDLRI